MTAPHRPRRIPAAAWIVAALSVACGKPEPPATALRSPADAASSASTPIEAGPPLVMDDLWSLAGEGDDLDLSRLARREGPGGLVRALDVPEARRTVLRALAFAEGPPEILALARIAARGDAVDAADAALALDTLVRLAARPRRAGEIEDTDEIREGLVALLALARDASAPTERRLPAIAALRMFADAGMLRREEIPTDLDAR